MTLHDCDGSVMQIENPVSQSKVTLHKNIYVLPYIYGKPLNKNEHSYEEILLVGEYLYQLLLYIRKILEVEHTQDNYIMDQMFENQTNYMWMTTKLSCGECIGRDILDCDPNAINQFSNDITTKSLDDYQKFGTDYDTAFYASQAMDKQKYREPYYVSLLNTPYYSTTHPTFS